AAARRDRVEFRQAQAEEGGLDRVHAEVAADELVVVLRPPPVDPQAVEARDERVVVAGQESGITKATEVLRRIEGDATDRAHRRRDAGPPAAEIAARADRLRRVLDDRDVVP